MYKILTLENDKFLLEVLSEWLMEMGFYSVKAHTVQEGYERLKEEDPDLILCSYTLPDGTGLELLQKIRRDFKDENTPFILTTGYELKTTDSWQTNYLPNAILYKPFWPEMLLEMLHCYLPDEPKQNKASFCLY